MTKLFNKPAAQCQQGLSVFPSSTIPDWEKYKVGMAIGTHQLQTFPVFTGTTQLLEYEPQDSVEFPSTEQATSLLKSLGLLFYSFSLYFKSWWMGLKQRPSWDRLPLPTSFGKVSISRTRFCSSLFLWASVRWSFPCSKARCEISHGHLEVLKEVLPRACLF